MTASVYAASSIHSKSTLSRKYDVDTSAMFNMGEQFHDSESANKNSTTLQLLQAFSLDIGRFDFKFAWINTIRLFIFPFFLMFSALGLVLIDTDGMDSISKNVFDILRYIMIFTPENSAFNVVLSVNLVFLIVYATLVIFLFHLINLYKNGSCPTTFQVYFWAVASRVIMPLFTTYLSHIFSNALYCLISNAMTEVILSSFIISIPLILAQILYIFFSCSVYNATPIIRRNDITQLWFSQSQLDWLLNLVLFFQVLLQNIIKLVPFPGCTIAFAVLVTAIGSSFIVFLLLRLPYIHPRANAVVLASAFSGPFCSLIPMISYYQKSGAAIALLALVVLIMIMFFLAKIVINFRMKKILDNFARLQETNPDEDKSELDPLSAAFMQLNPTRAVDFAKLGLKGEKDFSLYLRIGFLFNQQEVCNHLFIKWTTDQNIKADLVLSACQVSYALQSDVRMLNTLEQLCHKLGSAPFNSRSFVILFNHLRQELLTQLNQPLLEAIGKAKKADHALQSVIAEFWGAVLKQKVDTMLSILPQISSEMMRTDILFQRLTRNYPRSPTIFRETVLFYHKSIGDHHKTLEAQSMYNKTRNQNNFTTNSSSDSQTSTSFGDVDNDFRERMEPWIAAQEVISHLSIPSQAWLTTLVVISFLSMCLIPIIILCISLVDIGKFQSQIEPVQTVGNIEHAISRIPQLLRRKQLWVLKEIREWFEATGPPLGTILEFLTEDKIVGNIAKYSDILKAGSNEFLGLCTVDSVIYSSCVNSSHPMITGNATKYSTVYEILTSFEAAAREVVEQGEDFDWKNANSTSQLLFVFQNFDEIYSSITEILMVLRNALINYRYYFSKMTKIYLALIWAFPIVIIVPLLIRTIYDVRRDIVFNLRLFFQIPKSEISSLRWATKAKKNKTHNKTGNNNFQSSATEASVSSSFDGTNYKNEDMADNLAAIPRKTSGLFLEFVAHLIVFLLFTAIMTSIGIVVFNSSMMDIIEMSNGYVKAIEVASSALASYTWTQEIFSKYPLLYNDTILKQKSKVYIKQFQELFDEFLYGGNDTMTPAILLGQDVINAYIVSNSMESSTTPNFDPVYGVLHAVYFSMSCESQMRLLDELARFIMSTADDAIVLTFQDDFVYHYEHLLFVHLDGFLVKGKELFNEKTNNLNKNKVDQLILVFIVMFVIQAIYIFTILLNAYMNLKHHIYTPHNLMQLVTPEALLKNQTLIKWLSGLLTSTTRVFAVDTSGHSKVGLSDFAIKHTRCGLIITDEHARIVRINDAVCSLFKTKSENIINSSLKDFFSDHLIDKDKSIVLKKLEHQIRKMHEGNHKTNRYTMSSSVLGSNSQLMFLEITVEGFNENDEDDFPEDGQSEPPAHAFSVTVYDRTTEHYQEALVESEKKKSEHLVASLMPESIVKRLNDGETDISFEVQKATILFASVYKWNEVIANKTAVQVVAFLNKLFSAYDEELANFPAITKLKTIGHIYMIASGLFTDSSVNSSKVAAEFALKMLEIVEKLSSEMDNPFQITVGLNTGGPINCGILGHTRPVFDIIGDSVNVASRMNSSGIPGLIQITESTYEDIKFMKFFVRERGEIHIKGKGIRKTYLMSLTNMNGGGKIDLLASKNSVASSNVRF
ncbi:Adenylate and Guanylate cyclase catalytic domain containing protein [Tritrichomonas foetus]|uniref:Adenylate and Guanylate cyclase catalytic domain containing protein n=1 Tax=Tritrichomonas foetus TaxID=1144522 RepID=A0A1J4K1W8_9EUKA|nr:Adenylate and Guanylate cyclase catalytic domain containing protein [Tritrichomonas foetus]|eukprot:OHT03469.1 Adenylate and Guanylate cyclase catalytic domain containing protein [Tritrichomonas foetus]